MLRVLICTVAIAAASAAFAQEVRLPSYKLEVTQAELDVISDALGEVQYKRAAPLIQKLNGQIIEQIEAAKKAQDERNKAEQAK